jgi:hypothetical protein
LMKILVFLYKISYVRICQGSLNLTGGYYQRSRRPQQVKGVSPKPFTAAPR